MTDHAPRRSGQLEPVACALDVLGDHSTLLVVRLLVLGLRRWTDLVHDLPGIGKNLLSARLHELTDTGVISSDRLPWASSSTVLYRLGPEAGLVLPAVRSPARYGLRALTCLSDGAVSTRPAWAALSLWAAAEPPRPVALGFAIDDEPFTLRRVAGTVVATRGLDAATPPTELTIPQAVALAVGRPGETAAHRRFASQAGLAA